MLTEGDAVLSHPLAGKAGRKKLNRKIRGRAVRPIIPTLKAAGVKKASPKKGHFI